MSARMLKRIRKNMDAGKWKTKPDQGPGSRSSRKRRRTYDGGRRPVERKRGIGWIMRRYYTPGGGGPVMPILPPVTRPPRDFRKKGNRSQEQERRRRQMAAGVLRAESRGVGHGS